LRANLSTLKAPDMKDADAIVEHKNSQLVASTIKLIGLIGIVGIVISLVLITYFKLNKWSLFKECFFGVSSVLLVEYVFLTYITKNYKSLDPNWVKLRIVQNLQDYTEE
jgi:hypothetical protein